MTSVVEIQCLLFAKLKDMILGETSGTNSIKVVLPSDKCTTFQLMNELKQKYPSVSNLLDVCMVAINLEYIDKTTDALIKKSDEVAIIPPVSGG